MPMTDSLESMVFATSFGKMIRVDVTKDPEMRGSSIWASPLRLQAHTALWEAEVGGSLEARSLRPAWAT